MLERTAYLDRINGAGDEPCVKTLAGIRHGGKSFLFYRFISGLKQAGIDDEHIIYLNFERAAIDDSLRTAREIEALISEKTEKSGKYYLFLDEIQTVSGWERAVASLRRRRKLNIYIAVSDAAPLLKKRAGKHEKSGVLGDLIDVKPLSFAEYKQFFAPEARPGCGLLNKAMALKNEVCNHFDNYVRYGGFPSVYTGLSDSYAGLSGIGAEEIETMAARLNDIYSSILLNDVIRRSKIRNVELLELIIDIIFLNIGKENSTLKITEYLRKKRYKKNLSLVSSYIKALESAFVLKKVYRCNLETGRLINKNVKYFIGDHALLNAVKGIKKDAARGIGENILVHDLERRGYAVYSGKLGRAAVIDFAAVRENDFIFLQTIDKTYDGEAALNQKIGYLNLLNGIEKFCLQKKYVVFLDGGADKSDSGGVCFMSLQDFLLRESV